VTTFREAFGRKVVSRADATVLGSVDHLVPDLRRGAVSAIVLGSGKGARVLDWQHIQSFGPDAIVVSGASDLRDPTGDLEERVAAGKGALLGAMVLDDRGCRVGEVEDVTFEQVGGWISLLQLAGSPDAVPIAAVRGFGSFALMVSAAALTAPPR
jgi:uncharacterized protein YrrD